MTRLFSKAQRKELFERAQGQCEGTGPKVKLPEGQRCMNPLGSNWIADHVEPYECGGETEIENGWALCVQCNLIKTGKFDIPRISKNRRVREKTQGVRRRSGRGFATNRDGPLKAKMNGTIERR